MQSSFNVIKNSSINENGKLEIKTNCSDLKPESNSDGLVKSSFEVNYENLANSIIENARKQSEHIISDTYTRANAIEKEAYEKGYSEGEKQGYTDSYDRAYEEHVLKAQHEAEGIINEAEQIANYADKLLLNSKHEYEQYLDDKKNEIKDLVLEIVKNILKKEVHAEDSINLMVMDALNQVKSGKNFVIKCNSNYVKELKACIEVWKKQLTFKCEVFVIDDDTVELGNAVVEKDNGHLEVGIDVGFTKVKKILEEND